MLTYDILKAGHIVAVVVWFGGMMVVVLWPKGTSAEAAALKAWDRHVTTPAMLATWALGLTMATWAGWFASGWMTVKLTFVLALSAVHGVLSGRLRRAAVDPGESSGPNKRLVLSGMVAILCAIVLLVVTKPF